MALLKVAHVSGDGVGPDRVRRLMATISGDSEGIVGTGDFLVSEKAGTPNMSIDVAVGRAFVFGTEATVQGTYFCETDTVANLVIAAGDASNPRIDVVVAQVRDSDYSGASADWRLFVVAGTPAASPVAPAIPANSIKLAEVAVAALESTSILNAVITDFRAVWAPVRAGSITATELAAGAVTPPELVFHANGTAQVIPTATGTFIDWNETIDINNGHTPAASGNTYTIPAGQDGLYLISVKSAFIVAMTNMYTSIDVGSDWIASGIGESTRAAAGISAVFALVAGDTIKASCYHANGTDATMSSGSFLRIVKLA